MPTGWVLEPPPAASGSESRRPCSLKLADLVPATAAGEEAPFFGTPHRLSDIVTEKIEFSSGKATIRRASHGLLDKIAAVMTRYAGIKKIQVKGYTDSDGDDAMNLELSQARVDAVVAYLVDAGIAADRLEAKGYGEANPIGDNATADGKAMNRRVEFEILSQDVAKRTKRRMKDKVEKVDEASGE